MKLKDIADVQLGQDSYAYTTAVWTAIRVYPVWCFRRQDPSDGSKPEHRQFLDEARKDLPKGVELTQMMSSNDFLFASIHEVEKT